MPAVTRGRTLPPWRCCEPFAISCGGLLTAVLNNSPPGLATLAPQWLPSLVSHGRQPGWQQRGNAQATSAAIYGQQTLLSGRASGDAASQFALILSSEHESICSAAKQEGSQAAANAPRVKGAGFNGANGHDFVGVVRMGAACLYCSKSQSSC